MFAVAQIILEMASIENNTLRSKHATRAKWVKNKNKFKKNFSLSIYLSEAALHELTAVHGSLWYETLTSESAGPSTVNWITLVVVYDRDMLDVRLVTMGFVQQLLWYLPNFDSACLFACKL